METLTIPTWTLGDRLRKARENAGYTQSELAERIGISRRSVVSYEAGNTTPSRPVLLSTALATGVPLEWLAEGDTTADQGKAPIICDTAWSRRHATCAA